MVVLKFCLVFMVLRVVVLKLVMVYVVRVCGIKVRPSFKGFVFIFEVVPELVMVRVVMSAFGIIFRPGH